MNTNEKPNFAIDYPYVPTFKELEKDLKRYQQLFKDADDERKRLEDLNYSVITGLKSICRHRPSALRQLDAIQGGEEIKDVYYAKAYGETPCLMVHYYDHIDGEMKLVRVRLED